MGGLIFTDLVVKSMGKRGEREKGSRSGLTLHEEHDEHTQNSHNARPISLAGGHRFDRILARKDRSTCSLDPTRRGKNTLERVLTSWQRDTDAKALYNEGGAMQTPTRW